MKFIQQIWNKFKDKHPEIARFLVYFLLCNAVTVLQLILMPILKAIFGMTNLVEINFQICPIGKNVDGTPFYIFNYIKGEIAAGGGGGLAYFLAVQLTIAIAQVVNFFAQRNITFKATGSVAKAAIWYFIAYVTITICAAALQGLYKAPMYNLFLNTWNMGKTGETLGDVISMIINCALSFWIFYPISKYIFKTSK